MNMSKICMVCHKDPTSHSFSKLCQDGKTSIFYTNVGEATKYNDRKGIITHMDNMLINHVPDKWAWIFDAGKFQQNIDQIAEDKHKIRQGFVYNG